MNESGCMTERMNYWRNEWMSEWIFEWTNREASEWRTNLMVFWHLKGVRAKRSFIYGFSFAGTGSGAASWKSQIILKEILIYKMRERMNDWMNRWIKYEIKPFLNEWDLKRIHYPGRMNEWMNKNLPEIMLAWINVNKNWYWSKIDMHTICGSIHPVILFTWGITCSIILILLRLNVHEERWSPT